jgi:hypothetical protein
MPASSRDDPPSEGAAPSPLSLSALRDLAAVLRRLQEEAAQRGEEQDNAGAGAREDTARRSAVERADAPTGAGMGELPAGGSAPAGAHDPAGGAPPGGGTGDRHPPEEVMTRRVAAPSPVVRILLHSIVKVGGSGTSPHA